MVDWQKVKRRRRTVLLIEFAVAIAGMILTTRGACLLMDTVFRWLGVG